LIKTIESQEKSIEELRESVRLSKLEISSVGILSSQKKYPSAEECSIMAIDDHTTPPNNINIVDKVL
jgi:HD superfamily phosphohydrolase YqeK